MELVDTVKQSGDDLVQDGESGVKDIVSDVKGFEADIQGSIFPTTQNGGGKKRRTNRRRTNKRRSNKQKKRQNKTRRNKKQNKRGESVWIAIFGILWGAASESLRTSLLMFVMPI